MKQVIRLTESELNKVISESVKRVLNESFMDDLRTNAAYIKNKVKDNFPPQGWNTTDRVIESCKRHIQWMEENLQNGQKCGSKFLHAYNVCMDSAKKYGYVKYYKKMKELYDQMVEQGLYQNESDINGLSFEEIYGDLNDRVKNRGGHFHG